MRLTAIKLAGFKSFVDSTTFHAPTNLTGVVGPNGCGKSNIIDAVRWVMGEGSARVLRGELMSDVIFSGSSTRKPVGTATVELVFDNSDGKIGGEFARFAEISVKRTVARDGISHYVLNGTRCRRKDIRDLFLGTGLGSKSYSIIEQGMISQVVDAKPEDIREHLEEAAGISKYKERRRETENRIRHTRDNLDRLSDLREEVSSHLERLKRQARAAERYGKLKQQRRDLSSRLLALQWRDEMQRALAGKETLRSQETQLQAYLSAQRAAESELESIYQLQAEATEAFNGVQAEFYEIGSDIARLEQTIAHTREIQARLQEDYDEVTGSLGDLEQHMVLDRAQVEDLTAKLAQSEPALKKAQVAAQEADDALELAEAEVQSWQEKLEGQYQRSQKQNQAADQLRARIEVLDQRMAAAVDRMNDLGQQGATVDTVALEAKIKQLAAESQTALSKEDEQQRALDTARIELSEFREQLRNGEQEVSRLRGELQSAEAQLDALKALQSVNAGEDGSSGWLKQKDLHGADRLFSAVSPEQGWETAVETVVGHWLDFVLTADPVDSAAGLDQLNEATLGLLSDAAGRVRARTGSLAEKVKAPDAVIAVLNHVVIVDSLTDALEYCKDMASEESAITRAGEWVGPGWVRIARGPDAQSGVLAREQEISRLESEVNGLQDTWQRQRSARDALIENVRGAEDTIEKLQKEVNALHRQRADAEGRLVSERDRSEYLNTRSVEILAETTKLTDQQALDQSAVKAARKELDEVLESMADSEAQRQQLDQQRSDLVGRRDSARAAALKTSGRSHELALATSAHRASLDSLNQSLERMDSQVNQLQQRYLALSEQLAKRVDPEAEHSAEMDRLLQQRLEIEKRLTEARNHRQSLEERYRKQDAARQGALREVEDQRATLERARLALQEIELAARNLKRQVEANEGDVEALASGLPEDAASDAWVDEIEKLNLRIARLEPVNLAAIQEYDEELKRKEYLDAQNEDLIQALETLENAIARIDRKTRTRFKDTFEMVNKGIQELFPRLFGGGHAYLELTGEDLLTTGVSIMARPPGKRVSSIHLLSGGEKALTAVAFVFSIFRLNPAPFCLLDEVDAPLDDANVGRFSTMVKEMSESVQFIVVTHNKITMEMVHQLSGVTMREPGVSRLVQVDIEEAADLVAS